MTIEELLKIITLDDTAQRRIQSVELSLLSRFRSYFLLRCPSEDMEAIVNRQQALEFLAQPSQMDSVTTFQICLKDVKNILNLQKKLSYEPMRLIVTDWLSIYTAIKVRHEKFQSTFWFLYSTWDQMSQSLAYTGIVVGIQCKCLY